MGHRDTQQSHVQIGGGGWGRGAALGLSDSSRLHKHELTHHCTQVGGSGPPPNHC
jgi:hypothetical protein